MSFADVHTAPEAIARNASRVDRTGGVLLVGNFLSASRGIRCACEEAADRLSAASWTVVTTSSKTARVQRAYDMLMTTWRQRGAFNVALVDVFSGLSFYWTEAVCFLLRRLGKPYVLVLRGGLLPHFAERRSARVRRLLESADHVVAPSQFLKERMSDFRRDVEVLPNAIDIGDYPFRTRTRPAPRLVWLRAFHAIYNPAIMPRVVALLQAEFPDVALLMVGPDKCDGSHSAALRAAIDHGVANRIEFRGAVRKAEVPSVLAEGDIFINTSNVDNMPVTVIEAMACGLCIVSTNVGGMPHLIEDGVDGLLVEPDDADAVARAVRRILDEHGLAAALSTNARRKAESCDWSRTLPRLEQILSS